MALALAEISTVFSVMATSELEAAIPMAPLAETIVTLFPVITMSFTYSS